MEVLSTEPGLILWSLVALSLLACWVLAVIDILRSDFRRSNDKLIWVLVVVFMPFLGTILYFIIGRNNKVK